MIADIFVYEIATYLPKPLALANVSREIRHRMLENTYMEQFSDIRSVEYIDYTQDVVNWRTLDYSAIADPKLDTFIDHYRHKIDMQQVQDCCDLSLYVQWKYQKLIVWKYMVINSKLDEVLIDRYHQLYDFSSSRVIYSDEFMDKHMNKANWRSLSKAGDITDRIRERYLAHWHWLTASVYVKNLSLAEYEKYKTLWVIRSVKSASSELMDAYPDELNWTELSRSEHSLEDIKKHANRWDWRLLLIYNNIPMDLIRKHCGSVDINHVLDTQDNVDDDYIISHIEALLSCDHYRFLPKYYEKMRHTGFNLVHLIEVIDLYPDHTEMIEYLRDIELYDEVDKLELLEANYLGIAYENLTPCYVNMIMRECNVLSYTFLLSNAHMIPREQLMRCDNVSAVFKRLHADKFV